MGEISPLYNRWVYQKSDLTANESLKIMWEIGESLRKHIEDLNIPPHILYRQIYGKSKDNGNTIQRSYITREFQGRCYRIRNIFPSKEEINRQFPTLRKFNCFREAMPFFDNPKFVFQGKQKASLIRLLNSDQKPSEIKKEIRKLQKKYIRKTNTRTQRLGEIKPKKEKFLYVYSSILRMLKKDDYDSARKEIGLSDDIIVQFSQLVSALVSEEIIPPALIQNENLTEPFSGLSELLTKLFNKKNVTTRNRFRRLVPPERISMLSDMIYALSDNRLYDNFKSTHDRKR